MIKINILQNHPAMVEIFWYLEGVCVCVSARPYGSW